MLSDEVLSTTKGLCSNLNNEEINELLNASDCDDDPETLRLMQERIL